VKLKKIKQTYLTLKIVTVVLVGLAFFAAGQIDIPYTEEALRKTKVWTIIFIVSLILVAILVVLLMYFKPKAKKIMQESESLEEGTRYVFGEGEVNE
jgi:uncharacterized membrane protein